MRNMERLFIAILAIGIVGALSVSVRSAGRTSAPANFPVVSAPVVQVVPGQTQQAIKKAAYEAQRKIAADANSKAAYSIHSIAINELKTTAQVFLTVSNTNLAQADEAMKQEKWSEASALLISANKAAVQALQTSSEVILIAQNGIEPLKIALNNQKAKVAHAEKVLNAAILALGGSSYPKMNQLTEAKSAVTQATGDCK